ncbi:hypothetical protein BI380_11540 [Delftia tsuruhatensis]|uniref:Transposase n=1 Tax=Delftia tsuruhatensis TaxID=180282 RepID=A0ABM6E3C2_9BURK|nr:hypothetical protein BI380_11540 [Delftia tsuruhatensis]
MTQPRHIPQDGYMRHLAIYVAVFKHEMLCAFWVMPLSKLVRKDSLRGAIEFCRQVQFVAHCCRLV